MLHAMDMHTGGEPLRIVLDGHPPIEGKTILEKRAFCLNRLDDIRRRLIWEPRGHADMYGCYITDPNDPGAAFGVIFMHNGGYSTMCGHATIALGRWAVDMGIVPKEEPVTRFNMDAPCGRLEIRVGVKDGKVTGVSFAGVPSFALATEQSVQIPKLGEVRYDIAYGGAFYAIVDANDLGIELSPGNAGELIRAGMLIKKGIIRSGLSIDHPYEKDLGFLYGTIFTGPSRTGGVDSRNACIFADGELDRSPTGSGVAARLALHYHKGEISLNERLRVESITGSVFEGYAREEARFGLHQAVIPVVSGMAYYTGQHTFVIEEEDPARDGFFIR